MLFFYGDKISPNRTKTEEGFLIITNCPLARTGTYEYLASELGIQGNSNIVKVFRPPEEVFSLPAIASFNGKSITDNHPPVLLDTSNNGIYEKGTVINVRQGKNNESDLLLGDLIIKDPQLIEEIESGRKKEISCGYDCIYDEDENGNLIQRQIRGNHVAIVENGRAGSRVAVKDNSTIKINKNSNMEGERKKMNKINVPKRRFESVSHFFESFGLKHYAQDAEPEAFAEAVDALTEERAEKMKNLEPKKEEVKVKDAEIETSEQQEQENSEMAEIKKAIADLAKTVNQLVTHEKTEKEPEETIDDMIKELSGGEEEGNAGDQEASVTVPVEELTEDDNEDFVVEGEVSEPSSRPKNPIKNADSIAMIKALKAMKPVITAIKDPVDRKKACDSLMAEFKKAKKKTGLSQQNGYKGIVAAQRQNAQQKAAKANDTQNKLTNIQDMYNKEHEKYKKGVK